MVCEEKKKCFEGDLTCFTMLTSVQTQIMADGFFHKTIVKICFSNPLLLIIFSSLFFFFSFSRKPINMLQRYFIIISFTHCEQSVEMYFRASTTISISYFPLKLSLAVKQKEISQLSAWFACTQSKMKFYLTLLFRLSR